MLIYNEHGVASVTFPEHSLAIYAKKFQQGEIARFPSPVETEGPCPTVALVVSGSVKLTNSREPENPWIHIGGLTPVFNEGVKPGIYTTEWLEDDSSYICLSASMPELSALENALKTDWPFAVTSHTFDDADEPVKVLVGEGHTRIIVCLVGRVAVHFDGVYAGELMEGDSIDIPVDALATIDPEEVSVVAWPFTKTAP